MDPILERYQALEEKVLSYNPNLDTKLLYSAFQYADQHHSKQVRRDGTPYITHPLAVADILADYQLDTETLLAALLHDCIEDTDSTHEEIATLFGDAVANLVEGVTKLTRFQYVSMEEKLMENLRKMLMATNKDIRVMLVKLCDRLHNMRTMQYQSPKKQKEKSLETMEIYAPIAHRLGMSKLKYELEDLSLKYLDRIAYQDIEAQLNARFNRHQEFLSSTQRRIKERMEREGIECTITSREKHIYSIHKKMYVQHKTLDEIFDLYALRIIVNNLSDCYNALGHIHDMFKPVPGRFKDYISTPKPNGYQSLHTTVIGREGIPFEVQIRTWEMHETAEYGVAAHWKYKQGIHGASNEQTYEWVRKLLESQQDTEAEEFVKSLKVDLFSDEVFVFTPKGEPKSLPANSTPIDYAYSIHSAIGNSMIGAKVNGRLVPYDTKLQNGDIVEIQTSKTARGPSRDWIKLCKSNEARNKIRQWFKRERRPENIVQGRIAFEAELKRNGYNMAQITDSEVLPRILKKVQYNSLEDMYAAIGYGGVSAMKMVNRVKGELITIAKEEKEQTEAAARTAAMMEEPQPIPLNPQQLVIEQKQKRTVSKTGVVVEGENNCQVKFAKCCTPVPGDPIVGFITRGYGVSVHRTDCPNANPLRRRADEAGRWIPLSWEKVEPQTYVSNLVIHATNRPDLLLDVAKVLSEYKIPTSAVNAKSTPDGYATIFAEIRIRDRYDLNAIVRKLKDIPDVMEVYRGNS
jgi:GTP pyrophosphokinase